MDDDSQEEGHASVWTCAPDRLLRFRPAMGLKEMDCAATPGFLGGKADAERFIDACAEEIARYQQMLYACGRRGFRRRLLIVLQGMDASGKGSVVKHVFRQVNPMGIHYHGFGAPDEEERRHDFLWRVRRELPEPGWIAIFDRSHYEDIVMPHVWGTADESVWRARYDEVNAFERELVADGCAMLKIFLAVSKEEQKRHFLARLDDPTKHWKFDESDLAARERWSDYMDAWQDVFEHTSTPAAPWYLVPADHRWYSRAVVSQLLREVLAGFDLQWPPLDAGVDAAEIRRRLAG